MVRVSFYMYIDILRKIILLYYNRAKFKNFGQDFFMVYSSNCNVNNFDKVKLHIQVHSNVVLIDSLFFSVYSIYFN